MHIKIKTKYEGMINELIEENKTEFVKPTPSDIVHGILDNELQRRNENKNVFNDPDYPYEKDGSLKHGFVRRDGHVIKENEIFSEEGEK